MSSTNKSGFALITGATGGLGRKFAHQLAAEKNNLILVGRNRQRLLELAREVKARVAADDGVDGVDAVAANGEPKSGTPTIHVIACDLAQPGAAQAVESAVKRLGCTVDLLVNNAGFGYDAPFAQSDLSCQRELVTVNDLALVELTHAFLPPMVARGSGAILNVASIAGFLPGPYMATYYASKAFVQSFSQAVRLEVRDRGVNVCALCPGPVDTGFWNAADAGHTNLARTATGADVVVRRALRSLRHGRALCVPGAVAKLTVASSRVMPRSLLARVAALLQAPRQ